MNGLDRDILDKEFIEGWIEGFSNYDKVKEWPQAYYLTNNVKLFLRSLYFRTVKLEKYDYITKKVLKALQENVKLF